MRWCLLAFAACNVDAAPVDVAPEPPALPRPLHIAPIRDNTVDVFVERDRVAVIDLDQLRSPVHLDLLTNHPIADWASIEVRGDHVGPTTWLDPGHNFKNPLPLIYLDGKRAAVGLFAPGKIAAKDALLKESGIDEIRIALAKKPKSSLEQLAVGCAESKTELPPPVPERWHGTTHQFNLDVYWQTQLTIKLGPGAVGTHIGVLTQRDAAIGKVCVYDIYREPDRNGRRAAHAVLRPGPSCVDDLLEFVCNGTKLEVFSYYVYGDYVEHGLLAADPPAKK
jgi:hypothetical protein